MATKIMLFVDGSWLYRSRQVVFEKLGETGGCEIDYKRIPDIVAETIEETLDADIDIVRTNYYGTIPAPRQGFNLNKQQSFYDFLSRQCAYDTEIYETDFHRDGERDEKWVNVAIASAMTYYASIPGAFDIAVLIAGDADYIPLLRRVRAMGKRVQLVSTAARDLTSPLLINTPGTQDMPPIFLEDHAEKIRLVRQEQKRVCKQCGREEVTTWAGPDFFCSECRNDRRRTVRVCDTCGREEETTWSKPFFYCSACRAKYRGGEPRPEAPEAAPAPAPEASGED